jgi:hypothetical protein
MTMTMPTNGESGDITDVLKKKIFRIRVELKHQDKDGKEVKKPLLVDYEYGREYREWSLANSASFNLTDQLEQLVIAMQGVEGRPSKEFWDDVHPKHQVAIVNAIMADLNPNMTTSMG